MLMLWFLAQCKNTKKKKPKPTNTTLRTRYLLMRYANQFINKTESGEGSGEGNLNFSFIIILILEYN